MPAISNTIWSIASFDAVTQAIRIVRHAHARRARLSIDPTSGEARLTVPARGSVKAALRWAKTQRHWIAAQRSCLPERRPFAPGVELPLGDRMEEPRRGKEWFSTFGYRLAEEL